MTSTPTLDQLFVDRANAYAEHTALIEQHLRPMLLDVLEEVLSLSRADVQYTDFSLVSDVLVIQLTIDGSAYQIDNPLIQQLLSSDGSEDDGKYVDFQLAIPTTYISSDAEATRAWITQAIVPHPPTQGAGSPMFDASLLSREQLLQLLCLRQTMKDVEQ